MHRIVSSKFKQQIYICSVLLCLVSNFFCNLGSLITNLATTPPHSGSSHDGVLKGNLKQTKT